MASEVLYDVSCRYIDWDFIQLRRLGDALLKSDLVDIGASALASAFIVNLESRLGLNHVHSKDQVSAAQFTEALDVATHIYQADLDSENRQGLESVASNIFSERQKESGFGQAIVEQSTDLVKKVKAELIVYHLQTGRLPESLEDTGFGDFELPFYAEKVSYQAPILSIKLSEHLLIPESLEGSILLSRLEIEDNIVVENCVAQPNTPARFLSPSFTCSE
jgi:hypothetical protein